MPEIQYPTNPNSDTAFVVQEDGTKNRALMTAPQDTSTLELPSNANSTKGYVTIDGKKQRVILTADIGGGGGGGDQHNLGYYATQAALEEAHPTAEAGDWAIVGATDTVWIWDTDNSEWVDSDQKGQVTSVNGQTGDVVIPAGATYTAGTGISIDANNEISVTDPVLVNNTTIANSIAIGDNSAGYYGGAVAIGLAARAVGTGSVSIGNAAVTSTNYAIMIGNEAKGKGLSIGCYAKSDGAGAIAIGTSSLGILSKCEATARGAIQLGTRITSGSHATNSDANTFKVANENGNFEIMSADGSIPSDRLTHAIRKLSTMPTAGADYVGQSVQFDGTTDSTYTHGYIYECKAQGTDPETYAWEAMTVQAGGGGSSYTAGTGIDITNDVISVQTPVFKNSTFGTLAIGTNQEGGGIGSVSVGVGSDLYSSASVCIGRNSEGGDNGVAIGDGATSSYGGISIGKGASGTGGKFHIALTEMDPTTYQSITHQYDLVNIDGTIPADRIAPTTGLADGNYRLRLVMASGVPTLEWVAE